MISTELLNNSEGFEQYEFVNADLASAASDPNIDWIIVYYHKEAYTSPYIIPPNAERVRLGSIALRDMHFIHFLKNIR
jgi:hypothetical protein